MKKTIKIVALFIICNLLFLTSCQNEDFSEEGHQEHLHVAIERRSFNEFQKLPKLVGEHIRGSQVTLNRNSNSDPLYAFEIDSTTVTQISYQGSIYYTMAIVRQEPSGNAFENLVIIDSEAASKAYLIKYFLSDEHLANIQTDSHTPFVGNVNIIEINPSVLASRSATIETCVTYTQVMCNEIEAVHVPYAACTGAGFFIQKTRVCVTSPAEYPELVDSESNGGALGGGTGPGNTGTTPTTSSPTKNLLVTEPIKPSSRLNSFISQLTAEQKSWWNNITNINAKQDIIDYLQQNTTQEAEDFAQNVIDEIKNNIINTSSWASNILLLAPSGPEINNITEYLKCFDLNQPATFTIYADQPTPNDNDSWAGNISDPDVGHTFVSIKQGNIRRVIGYYPGNTVNPFTSPSTSSILINDSGHTYDAMISITITPSKLQNMINYIKNYPTTYNLNSYNCTDFGMSVSKLAGLTIPSAHGSWPGGSGDNPGQLGQNLRNIPLPANATRTTTTGTAASNMGSCN